MNKNDLKKRIKYCKASTHRITESKPTSMSRRDENSIGILEANTEDVVADFFEFEKELSEMKPANKLGSK